MASIIQKKAAFATVVGSGSVAVTLNSPISAGSTLVISSALVQSNASGAQAPVIAVNDDLSNGYSPTSYNSSGSGWLANTYQGAAIPQAGARTYTLNFTAPVGQSAYTFLAGICVYELKDVPYSATGGNGSQSLTGFHKVSDLTASPTGLVGGTYGNFVATIAALVFTSTLADAQAAGAGSGWTLDGSDAINGTNPMAIVFESQLVDSTGNPSATFSGNTNITELDGTILVAAYPATSAISGGGSSTIFLGSVRVVGSIPGGQKDVFLGTVKVVASPPNGASNPYLGSVVVGTPSGSQTNPSLGEVVVVGSAPAGDTDPFLGTIEEA